MSVSDENYNIPFLRNEFTKIFEDFFINNVIYKDFSYL